MTAVHFLENYSRVSAVVQCLLVPPFANTETDHKTMIESNLSRKISVAEPNVFADLGSLFAFCGGAAVGQATNAFGSLAMSIPFAVVSVLTVELAY